MKRALPLALAAVTALPVAADEATAIQARVDAAAAAMQAGDLDGVLSGYAPGAVVDFGAQGIARGEAELTAAYGAFLGAEPAIAFGGHKVLVAGDLALHFSDWTAELSDGAGGKVSDGGFSVVLMRRDPDGQWRMVIDAPYATAIGH